MRSAKSLVKSAMLLGTSLLGLSMATGAVQAGGEAGVLTLRDQGFFYVGVRPVEVENGFVPFGQMYVGFHLPAEVKHKYPIVLVHGGGGQSTDWFGTPDNRDGWLDYLLADGFEVYHVDRPGFGRSPNNTMYGELAGPGTFEQIEQLFTGPSDKFPGGGAADSELQRQRVASGNPGPSVDNAILQENLVELLEKIGPAIIMTASAGGPSGWLALDAAPDLVKGVVGIEPSSNFNSLASLLKFEPALEGDALPTVEVPAEREGLVACNLQEEGKTHTLPSYKDKPILNIVSSNSPLFTPNGHCAVHQLNQFGAKAELVRLEDVGLPGYGHFMSDEIDSDKIVTEVIIPWIAKID